MARLVEIDGLSKVYEEADRERIVLHDLTASFESGEISSIRGRSGSGKSTLLNLIAGIDQPTDGSIRIEGQELTKMSPRQRAHFRQKNIGFVFQFFNLIPTLSVIENVSLPSELAGRRVSEARQRAFEHLQAVGLSERQADFPDQLSGGEQQRIAIARALVERPRLVLADEPTGNLDETTGAEVLSLLERLVREHQVTLILATHSHELSGTADRQYWLHDGRLQPDAG
jgi:putative ABC transport system ATP-binding protein